MSEEARRKNLTKGLHLEVFTIGWNILEAVVGMLAGIVAGSVASWAREIMSKNVPVCSPDDSITRVMAEMTRSRSRHLPVLKDGILCGIVSVGDVVKLRLEEIELEASVLRSRYIAGR